MWEQTIIQAQRLALGEAKRRESPWTLQRVISALRVAGAHVMEDQELVRIYWINESFTYDFIRGHLDPMGSHALSLISMRKSRIRLSTEVTNASWVR